MKYAEYSYIYPPRPSNAISPNWLTEWDNNTMLGQAKMNGSNCLIFTDGVQMFAMNRHRERLSNFRIPKNEVLSLYRTDMSGWLVINGEYLNKSKTDDGGQIFNHKLILFDILVHNSNYLIGKTFAQRQEILDNIYHFDKCSKWYLGQFTENIYRVNNWSNDFSSLFERLTSRGDVVEGLVLKRKSAKLEIGNTSNNNSRSQIKCRVATKNYKF